MAIIAHGSELQDAPRIDGRRLRHLSARSRAALAVSLARHNKLDYRTASKACGVSLSTVYRELAHQAPKPKAPAYAAHVEWWRTASFSDRVSFVADCNVSEVWDALSTAVA
jgi:hypothetical protein